MKGDSSEYTMLKFLYEHYHFIFCIQLIGNLDVYSEARVTRHLVQFWNKSFIKVAPSRAYALWTIQEKYAERISTLLSSVNIGVHA